MRIEVKVGQGRDSVPVIAAMEGERQPSSLSPAGALKSPGLMRRLGGCGFRGALNETALLPSERSWALVVGLGKPKDLTLERLRQFAGTAAKTARARGFRRLTLPVLSDQKLGQTEQVAQTLTEGAHLGLYRFDKFRQLPNEERGKRVDLVTMAVAHRTHAQRAKAGVRRGERIAAGVILARDLINGPSNEVTPTYLAHQARAIARQQHLTCRVLPFARLKRLGFGGIVGVARGSAHPAQFIVLDYRPRRARATVVLCGKGITFDTGGINLKPSAKMELMKYDMSGAAAVLGILQTAAALKLPVRVVGVIAATENMPSGTAQKPGDILKTLSGKTVEVLNTDAEGRLVLADCLHYAKRYRPDCVVDLATLTGACVIALGSEAVGLMSTNDRIAERLLRAGDVTHERLWRLPLWPEYGELMKSSIADIKNVTATGEAGTITGGKFLEAFAEGLPWAHLDIAGTAWADADKPYIPKGAVGVGVRLLIEFLEQWR